MSGETLLNPPYNNSTSSTLTPPLIHLFSNSAPIPLTYIELTPQLHHDVDNNDSDKSATVGHLSAPMAKLQLLEMSLKSNVIGGKEELRLILDGNDDDDSVNDSDGDENYERNNERLLPKKKEKASRIILCGNIIHSNNSFSSTITLSSDDPTYIGINGEGGIACRVRGYASILTKTTSRRTLKNHNLKCTVTNATFVQILPPNPSFQNYLVGEVPYTSNMDEKEAQKAVLSTHDEETISSLQLLLSSLLEKRKVFVGTTPDALEKWKQKQKQKRRNKNEGKRKKDVIQQFWQNQLLLQQQNRKQKENRKAQEDCESKESVPHSQTPFISDMKTTNNIQGIECGGGGLIIHSPHHSHGKTLLLTTLLSNSTNNTSIYMINAGALFAKYGVNYVDNALECIIHSIALRTAVCGQREQKVCIVLDHLDAFVPSIMSGRGGSGSNDAALPALNAMAAYISKLAQCIEKEQIIPYPTKNPMYNINSQNGVVLPLHLCLVGMVTCEDDGGKKILQQHTSSSSASSSSTMSNNILDLFGTSGNTRYRLPSSPSSQTRLKAFQYAFEAECIELDDDAQKILPLLAASAVMARGNFFQKVAYKLRDIVLARGVSRDDSEVVTATTRDVKAAMHSVQSYNREDISPSSLTSGGGGDDGGGSISATTKVSFLSNISPTTGKYETNNDAKNNGQLKNSAKNDLFASVGGNSEAKIALEDALALDVSKRQILAAFGLSAPTGVLLYGPPGTGKTLLARATAFALKSDSSSSFTSSTTSSSLAGNVGGAFISLRASDIVRSEVGTSEKVLVSAFETARKNAPSVVFIDEFQALFTERGGGTSGGGGSGRLASTLLQCMDDVTRWRDADSAAMGKIIQNDETKNTFQGGDDAGRISSNNINSRVVVLGATNTPWMVDKAFLRPGRFDQVVHVGLPNLNERESILHVHVSRMKIHKKNETNQTEDEPATTIKKICTRMARECEGFSGADIAALCRAAAIRCLHEKNENEGVLHQAGYVCERHFVEARLHDVTRSSNDELVKRILNWRP